MSERSRKTKMKNDCNKHKVYMVTKSFFFFFLPRQYLMQETFDFYSLCIVLLYLGQ